MNDTIQRPAYFFMGEPCLRAVIVQIPESVLCRIGDVISQDSKGLQTWEFELNYWMLKAIWAYLQLRPVSEIPASNRTLMPDVDPVPGIDPQDALHGGL
jgi:hypothetical protein